MSYRRILIDTGEEETAAEYIKTLRQVLKEEKATIEHMIITHWHLDHMGGANSVQDLVKSMNLAGTCSTIWKLPRSEEDDGESEAESSTKWQALKDGQIMEVEGAKLHVYHTPGHSTDHSSLLLEEEQALFSGDCILGERTAIFEDLYTYLNSLRKILALNPRVIYPGHGSVIIDPVASIQFYIDHRLKRENDILGVLGEKAKSKAMSEMDIAKEIYLVMVVNLIYDMCYKYMVCNISWNIFRITQTLCGKQLPTTWNTIFINC